MAVEMGYRNVMVYEDGIPGWAKAGYPLVSNATYPVVDIPLISAEQLPDGQEKVFLVAPDRRNNLKAYRGPGILIWKASTRASSSPRTRKSC
jgi:hypothetical protein